LPQFAYNRAPSYATLHSPFECVYGVNPLTPIDLLPIPTKSRVIYNTKARAKEMKRLHGKIRWHIEKANAAYKAKAKKHCKHLKFNQGSLDWLHLRKERFPSKTKNKLMSRRWTIQDY